MWNKDGMHEMDEETKAKWTAKLVELGMPEDKIDERLIWVAKMTTHKLSKLRLLLSDKGINEAKAKELINQLVNKALEKDLAKIREWRDKHQDT